MEEIKELVHLINTLPALALWVLVGFWAYKVIVVGSIYGVIRFVAQKIVEMYTNPKQVEYTIGDTTVNSSTKDRLHGQLERLKEYSYINNSGVDKLRDALDLYEEKYPKGK